LYRYVAVAAFKKYLLTSLIGGGALPPFPRYTAPAVQRHLKSTCNEYVALADAYKTRSGEQAGVALFTLFCQP
jgi:hypothetical protein